MSEEREKQKVIALFKEILQKSPTVLFHLVQPHPTEDSIIIRNKTSLNYWVNVVLPQLSSTLKQDKGCFTSDFYSNFLCGFEVATFGEIVQYIVDNYQIPEDGLEVKEKKNYEYDSERKIFRIQDEEGPIVILDFIKQVAYYCPDVEEFESQTTVLLLSGVRLIIPVSFKEFDEFVVERLSVE